MTMVCIVSSLYYAFCTAFRYDVEIPNNDHLDSDHTEHEMSTNAKHDFTEKQLVFMTYAGLGIELFMFIDFLIQFCLEYKEMDSTEPVKQLAKTAMRYAQNEMIYDLIPLIPL